MEISDWLQRIVPDVQSQDWRDGCWLGHIKIRSAAHHPPLHWLGRALDAVDAAGALDTVTQRIVRAHGPEACEGWSEGDQHAQDALTEACAIAWAAERLGPPQPVDAGGGRLLVRVPSVDAVVAPRRQWPVRSLDDLLKQIGDDVAQASATVNGGAGRGIVYVDLNLALDAYARDVGYHGPMTEPVREMLKFFGQEHGLGWVLTRPFEWGVPIEEWY
ncbi:MAG: hypothetical protein QF664_09140 [Dehalococcoidia bacterium]|jgi:hypothetical protein|nr:hypothetical protein [Dehalococcoidia bacterium]